MLWIAGLLRTPFRKRLFVTNSSTGESRLSHSQVERMAWLVNATANRHVKPMTCLERALTLQSLLARHGCHASLRFGVRKGDATVEAHAWLEGVPGLSDPLSFDFIPLKNFSERHCQN
ncbi:lasso peptide biosynthesis B2 protein [Mesorhizobium delmotii]|uniref:lasso peptide biosynthesis B2 protein n=1 Tax=Mesorhizobium delmotii TaxID=1631247 RepID=UPI003CC7DF99